LLTRTDLWLSVLLLAMLAGGAVGALLVIARRWKNTHFNEVDRSLADLHREVAGVRSEIEETRALVALQEPRFGIPLPWSNWALPPRGLLEVLKTVQEFEAPTIVECGSGVSTLHLARAVREIGKGRIIALEQDAGWAEYIGRMLARNDLAKWVTIVVAPLEKTVICDKQTTWYSMPENAIPADAKIDVVLVDGPRGAEGELSRLGALPRLWDRLSSRAVVFLDDTNRPEERQISELWRARYAVNELSTGSQHGMSRFTRRGA
jgi:predicted O-methyltransferase YrrM